MLTSSDAKWRCMWHMLVWSVLLTMSSQYLPISGHVALYIFAALAMIILPAITAIYSNTSGRHGSGLIRVAYVICDPVLACITITPVLVLNSLPLVVSHYTCLEKYNTWNQTCECLLNRSYYDDEWITRGPEVFAASKQVIRDAVLRDFFTIQISVTVPILMSLLMGRRTNKMSLNTYILTFAYWFITSIELVDMMETIRLGDIYHNVIFTTGAINTIAIIITNSYAVVTLCSFISPQSGTRDLDNNKTPPKPKTKFDTVYRIFVSGSAVLFTEIPLLVARFQMLSIDASRMLPATFYLWCLKDFLFLCLIIFIVLSQKFFKRTMIKIPCKVKFDNTDIIFQPEKRDEYIVSKKTVTFRDPPAIMLDEPPKAKPLVCIDTDSPNMSKDTGTPDVAKKKPNLKNSVAMVPSMLLPVQSLERSSSGYLTDLSSRRTSTHSDNSIPELSNARPPNAMTCLPLTDLSSVSSSRSSSPKIINPSYIGRGARPKVSTVGNPSSEDIREIKSRPKVKNILDNSGSDSDSLV